MLYADDVVLFASLVCDLQHVLGQFAAEYEVAGRRDGTSQSEVMVVCHGGLLHWGWGEGCVPKRGSLSISGFCSRVMGKWSVR